VRNQCTAIICLDKIFMYLITPYLTQRYETQTLRKELKIGIAAILNKDNKTDLSYEKNHLTKRLRCAREYDRKTTKSVGPITGHFAMTTVSFSAKSVLMDS